MTDSYTFKKGERLCSKKEISTLFDLGHSFSHFPFRIFWNISETELPFPSQMAVSVSKRLFKRAVDRNRIKRLIREAWRHNKGPLYSYLESHNINVVLMLVYTSSEKKEYNYISKKTEEAISKLLLILRNRTDSPV